MPTVGDKFKCKRENGIFAFHKEGRNGEIVWWDFFDVKTGKRRSFYPDEMYPVGEKAPRDSNGSKRASHSIEWDRDAEPYEIVVAGQTLKVV